MMCNTGNYSYTDISCSNGPNRVSPTPSLEDGNRSSFRNVEFFIVHEDGKVKVKLSLQQVVKTHRVVRRRGSHIF
jgi:hypothetical protein